MRALEDRILKEGKCLPGGALKVNTFLNHQMDLALMHSCAEEFARLFADQKVDNAIIGIDRQAETAEPQALREDERILRELQAELLAKIRDGADCGPFMAAIYDRDGRRLAEAVNSVVSSNCSHNHAEMNAIRLVEEKLGTWNLAPRDLALYTTSEPCMMCMGGILWSGIRKVVYGVPSGRVEALTGFDEGFKPDWPIEFARRGIEVVGPLAVEEGEAVHREYMRLQKTVYVPRWNGQGDVA